MIGKLYNKNFLTLTNFRCTVIQEDMANVLNTDKQIAIIGALAEGSSIRSIERMTGVHRDTIMRLGVRVGQGCTAMMDPTMRNLPCTRLEMDEIWGFVGKKERTSAMTMTLRLATSGRSARLTPTPSWSRVQGWGSQRATANAFVAGRSQPHDVRVQITTDGLEAYVEAIESAFGAEVDYGQIIKTYGT